MKLLKQHVAEINFQPVPYIKPTPNVSPNENMVAFEGEDGWWLGRTQNRHLFWVARNASATRLGGFAFFTDVNGELQPARMIGKSEYEAVEYGGK